MVGTSPFGAQCKKLEVSNVDQKRRSCSEGCKRTHNVLLAEARVEVGDERLAHEQSSKDHLKAETNRQLMPTRRQVKLQELTTRKVAHSARIGRPATTRRLLLHQTSSAAEGELSALSFGACSIPSVPISAARTLSFARQYSTNVNAQKDDGRAKMSE